MPDRKKVMSWLEGLAQPDWHKFHSETEVQVIAKSAVALLKETEAVVPKYNARTNWYECGACHYSMTSGMHCRSELIPATKVRYCANCGFPVNWEGRRSEC